VFAYIVKRLIAGFFVLVLVSMAIFALFWFGPEEPARPLCNLETSQRCDPVRLAQYNANLGYDNPVYEEYGNFAKGIFTGRDDLIISGQAQECGAPCFGYSFATGNAVWGELKTRLPATISVALGGVILYVLLGVPIGVAAARRRGTLADKALVSTFLVVSSIPYYLFALLVWLYVTIVWQVPGFDKGYTPLTENPAEWFMGLLLAWIALGIFGSTQYTRYSRGAMVEALSEDYIRTARAKGLPTRTVVYKHGLRAAMVPIVTIFGIDVGTLLAGTIFTERIFNIPGIGLWGLIGVSNKDLPVVQATALFGAFVMIIANLIVDLVYSALDPRVRLS
jgi:peptide/nickel transport system permease protein